MKKLVILTGFIFLFSCATKPQIQYIEKPVFVKCQIPDIPKAELETPTPDMSYSKKLEIILNNCLKIKKENELLREAIELCK